MATSGGGGGGGLLNIQNVTKPPASRPSIIRKTRREAAGSMAEIGESAVLGSSEDKALALEVGDRVLLRKINLTRSFGPAASPPG